MMERKNEEELADEAAEIFLKQALSKRKPVPHHTGFCLYCKAPIAHGAFCDSDCSDDYEFVNKKR